METVKVNYLALANMEISRPVPPTQIPLLRQFPPKYFPQFPQSPQLLVPGPVVWGCREPRQPKIFRGKYLHTWGRQRLFFRELQYPMGYAGASGTKEH